MIRLLTLAAALLLSTAAQAERYTVLCVRAACGQLSTTETVNGLEIDFSYRDNGRGPDQKEWFSWAADGAWASYRTEGVSTYGARIEERFERAEDGRAQWRSRVDAGESASAPRAAMYLPIEASPAWAAQLARGLLSHSGSQPALPALPSGSLSIERVQQLKAGALDVGLYAISGLDLMPSYIWLREGSGALFAQVSPGAGGTVLTGFEAEIEHLETAQKLALNAHLEALAKRLAHPLPGLSVIQNVRWFDAPAARLRGPSDVFIFEGRIAAIQPPASLAQLATLGVAQRIDGSGRTLMPGMVDMHAHIQPTALLLDLAAGVTAVRDVGNSNALIAELRGRIARGEVLGPRIAANGFIEGKSPFASQADFVPDTLPDALAAIDWYAAHGYRQLKLYNSIRPDWVKPMTAHAGALGLRVGGHVPAFMTATQAVRGGYRELHHINQVTLNFLVSKRDDTRTLLRFTLVGERAGEIKLNDARTRDFIALLKRTGTVVDPTAVAFEAMYLQRQGEMNPSYSAIAPNLPAGMQRGLRAAEFDIDDAKARRYTASWKVMLELTRRMHAAGIPLVAGTDATPGFAMQRELELYAQAGIPVPEVLRIATWNGAKHSDRAHEIGSIERGKLADVFLVDGDPTRRLADIRRVALVIQGGVAFAPDQLYPAMGIKPFGPSAVIEALK